MYLKWNENIITDFSDKKLEEMYDNGFVFTRLGKGVMNQTRSLRVDLNKFELSSENRRILNKTQGLNLFEHAIPYSNYDWTIHKMGKDFYEKKFGEKTFSAQKIKELITDKDKSNFNRLFVYVIPARAGIQTLDSRLHGNDNPVAYCIALETKNILHYCYPFYRTSDNWCS